MKEEKILFHGALEEIKFPTDDRTTSKSTDFGDGFYLTELQNQAEKWAKTKCKKAIERGWHNAKPIVNIYSLDRSKVLKDFKTKYFSKMTNEWLDFIISNRNHEEHIYDYVEGPMADDKIYNFVVDLLEGNITRTEFWEKAAFKYPTHQIMIRNDAIYCLKFEKSYEVESYEI